MSRMFPSDLPVEKLQTAPLQTASRVAVTGSHALATDSHALVKASHAAKENREVLARGHSEA
jgi:hypothetical protein